MTIKIISISETGKHLLTMTFSNSIDANIERDLLERCGIDYRVEWDCK